MNIIEIQSLSHRFSDGTWGIKNINLSFSKNEFVIIAGKNGSGKTLLMRHVTGLVSPTEGSVLYCGKLVNSCLEEVRGKIGLVFQDADSQLVCQTIEDELRFGPENARLPEEIIQARTEFVMKILGFENKKFVSPWNLSGGEKRKLAIGSILTLEPDIIILDEPFANLDYPGVVNVLRLLLKLKGNGHGIVIITHELEKTLAHADRLIILENGMVKENGDPKEIAPKAAIYSLHPLDFKSRTFKEYTWLVS